MDTDINYRARTIAGHKVLHFPVLTSTNLVLEEYHKQGHLGGASVVLADHQTEGRGMRGNTWEDEVGKNLLFSMIMELNHFRVSEQFYLSKYFSICLHEALKSFCLIDKLFIKWPNDLYIAHRKLGGILIQLSVRSDSIQYAILGAGINVNQSCFPKHLRATSLAIEQNSLIQIPELLECVLTTLDLHKDLILGRNWVEIDERYHAVLWGLNEFKRYTDGTNEFDACLRKVGADGKAEFELENGRMSAYAIKEITPVPVLPGG